jgi:hypothetical protein
VEMVDGDGEVVGRVEKSGIGVFTFHNVSVRDGSFLFPISLNS